MNKYLVALKKSDYQFIEVETDYQTDAIQEVLRMIAAGELKEDDSPDAEYSVIGALPVPKV